jgi:starch synthase
MTRVLAVIVAPPHLSVSGAGRAAEQLSGALADSCEITVASMMGAQSAGQDGRMRRVPVSVTLPPGLRSPRVPNRYRTLFYRSDIPDLIRPGAYDIVHIHNPMPALEMARIARACRRARIPYVVSTHGFNEIANGAQAYGLGLLKRLAWQLLVAQPVRSAVSGAAAIFTLSPADDGIVRGMGYVGEALVCVPNGVPTPPPADPTEQAEIYRRLGVSERRPGQITCMFLANHTPNKGLHVLLEAFSQLRCPYQLIVGGEKRPEVDYSAAQARQSEDQRIVVTGRLTDAEVAALFRRADLFVFPTLADTFPLSILEAMSYGVPVLASHVGGIPHQIDGRCGALISPGSVGELVDALGHFAREPELLAEMGRQARLRVMSQFTWESSAKRAAAEYERLLRPAAARSSAPERALSPQL